MTPEKQVQNSIIKFFKTLQDKGHPVFVERRQAGGFSYKKGIPDLYVVYNGKHIEIEVKKLGGKQSSMQEKFENFFKSINCLYICAESLEEVKIFMRRNIITLKSLEDFL